MPQTIFVAGATGAIGSRLIPLLVERGYTVFGLTRHENKAARLRSQGAVPILGDVFDADALSEAVIAARPEVIIHQLTDLPPGLNPALMAEASHRNARVRREGTANLMAAAVRAGTRLMVAQSIAWAYADVARPYVEDTPLEVDAGGSRGISVKGVKALEDTVLNTPNVAGIVLRFGQFYGPGTGSDTARGKTIPLHVDGAARATLLALDRGHPGVYNIAESNNEVSTEKARRELGWDDRPAITL